MPCDYELHACLPEESESGSIDPQDKACDPSYALNLFYALFACLFASYKKNKNTIVMEEGQNWVDETVGFLAITNRIGYLCESIMEFISIERERCRRGARGGGEASESAEVQ